MKTSTKKDQFGLTPELRAKGWMTSEELHEDLMRDPEYKKIWEDSRPAFALRSALVDARIKGEITQEEIAARAGTTQSAIARFESGRTQPTLAFMQRLAAALGKKIEFTFLDV